MSLSYSVVSRKVPSGEHAGETRFYGQIKSRGKIPFSKLCTKIALQSSATRGDVELILDGLISVLVEYLDEGYIVQMGQLGNYRMSAGCTGTEEAEDFTASMMKRGKVVFTPGEALRRAAREVKFEKENPKVIVETEECGEPHV